MGRSDRVILTDHLNIVVRYKMDRSKPRAIVFTLNNYTDEDVNRIRDGIVAGELGPVTFAVSDRLMTVAPRYPRGATVIFVLY